MDGQFTTAIARSAQPASRDKNDALESSKGQSRRQGRFDPGKKNSGGAHRSGTIRNELEEERLTQMQSVSSGEWTDRAVCASASKLTAHCAARHALCVMLRRRL